MPSLCVIQMTVQGTSVQVADTTAIQWRRVRTLKMDSNASVRLVTLVMGPSVNMPNGKVLLVSSTSRIYFRPYL